MELTGLDITLRRMQAIESTFNNLANFGSESVNGRPSQDFQKILDNSMSEKLQNTPFSNKIFSITSAVICVLFSYPFIAA